MVPWRTEADGNADRGAARAERRQRGAAASRAARRGGAARAGEISAWALVFVSVFVFALVSERCEGARLAGYLTARDRAGRLLLSQTGQVLPRGSSPHWGRAVPLSARPGYVAFPLLGGERIPSSVPTVSVGAQASPTAVGPLDLDPLLQSKLNAALGSSKAAIVTTPDHRYAVEFLPRYARLVAHQLSGTAATGPVPTTSTSSQGASTPSTSSLTALQNNLTIEGVRAKDLSHWIQTGADRINEWTANGLSSLERSLGLSHASKPAPRHRRRARRVAGEELVPPLASATAPDASAASTSGGLGEAPLPVPAPEPSSWLMGGTMIAALAFARRAAARSQTAAPRDAEVARAHPETLTK